MLEQLHANMQTETNAKYLNGTAVSVHWYVRLSPLGARR
jgi:hypothetical protein